MDISEVVDTEAPRHPWERARAKALLRILEEHRVSANSVLDFGCGDAFTGRLLAKALGASTFAGVDSALPQDGEDIVRDRSALGTERFDLLLLLDVLEHVAGDVELLRDVVDTHLRPGGTVLITVPAGPRLFGPHDEALGHYRRYTRRSVEAVTRRAGLSQLGSGSLFSALFAVRAVERALELTPARRAARPRGIGRWQAGEVVTRALVAILTSEARALRWVEQRNINPPGLSAWTLSNRP